jgi:hypothetical protein
MESFLVYTTTYYRVTRPCFRYKKAFYALSLILCSSGVSRRISNSSPSSERGPLSNLNTNNLEETNKKVVSEPPSPEVVKKPHKCRGVPRSEEVKRKISEATKGKKKAILVT